MCPKSGSERKHCWVCYQTEDESDEEWVRPCRCKGTSKWIHQQCLQRWIDEKQKNNLTTKVACSQCKTEYVLVFPPYRRFVYFLETCDRIIYGTSPFACGIIVIGSLYWSALSYGAVTVMQVLGQEEGKAAMEQVDPLTLLLGLPSIPLMLVLGKLIRWEDQVLKLWRKHYRRIPLLGYLVGTPAEKSIENAERYLTGRDNFSDPVAGTRMFCGALILPTIATVIGRYLYPKVSSNFHKTILGGLTFILAKGVLKIYLRQQQFIRQTNRKVLNFDENDTNDPKSKLAKSESAPIVRS
ncbi:hypothetical protein B4U79_00904 [Dinothrombium tinctorium]|uniref:E3 ubiquitin-protein ligase MARCHF5 n=1 Tax=Dinothrombium tinctorium TaxID=1965070 RepID=A0A443QT23_9ACAR|nr:hypothetical protein B4U79_00904 [Dinothrombium tinctorium]